MAPMPASDYDSSYRWVMALITAVVMTTSFISLTAFGVAAPAIAKTIGVPLNTLTTYGVDAFSIGLFIAFFLGHGGIFDTRIKSGIFLAQALLIVPQVLIPVLMPLTHSLVLFTLLRFSQGLVIMMIALFSIQLSGWFRPSQRGISLGAMLGAITLGGAIGGLITGGLAGIGWRDLYYVTALIMAAGAAVYFIFARDSAELVAKLRAARQVKHPSAWSSPMTWLMGIVQIPLTWTLFSIGGFMPAYAFHLGYKVDQVGHIMFIWGVVGFFAAVLGSLFGDRLARGQTTNRGVVNARLTVIGLTNLVMAVGALMVLYLAPISYGMFLISAIVVAFIMAIPPNYWATPASVFPLATVGAGAFGMGVISNSTSAIGPVVSSIMVPTFGWSGVFWIMAILSIAGVGVNLIAMRIPLPADATTPLEVIVTQPTHAKAGSAS
ncbi:MFS transporter [Acidiphilium sp.]|uniref:MFS transporter n=1 Tax=Acidiphilium sp. TaxID=527 RepID=UPI003D04C1EB